MRLLWALAALVAAGGLLMARALSPAAYDPTMSVRALTPAPPTKPPAAAFFSLIPPGCKGGACTGFKVSNAADFQSRTNFARFTPAAKPVTIEPWAIDGIYEIGTFNLTNKGLMTPADAGAVVVPVTAAIRIATEGVAKATNVSATFGVMWSPGSPAPPNSAGLFVLQTRNPAPSYNFTVGMNDEADVAFTFNLRLLGFRAEPAQAKSVTVLGDWGQPAPKGSEPGPRVYVEEGAMHQIVKLFGRISKID